MRELTSAKKKKKKKKKKRHGRGLIQPHPPNPGVRGKSNHSTTPTRSSIWFMLSKRVISQPYEHLLHTNKLYIRSILGLCQVNTGFGQIILLTPKSRKNVSNSSFSGSLRKNACVPTQCGVSLSKTQCSCLWTLLIENCIIFCRIYISTQPLQKKRGNNEETNEPAKPCSINTVCL